jgi:hypothetical protein
VELLGKTGTTKADIDRLCKRLQSKAPRVHIVYEAGPCGCGLYRELVQKGFDRKPHWLKALWALFETVS